ncbi:MAG TPA: AI-2E family transporter [Candidatus Cloacimonas sp.]|nr:AI-2E family transporter [Candidatus Cloacimonas sp.]
MTNDKNRSFEIMTTSERELRWIRYLLIVIALPVAALILKTLQGIFIPLVIAIFLSFLFAPLINKLKEKKVPIIVIIAIIMLVLFISFLIISSLLYSAAESLVTGLPKYQEKFYYLIESIITWGQQLGERMNVALEIAPEFDYQRLIDPGSFSITKMVSDTMGGFISLLWNIFLVLVFLLFLVSGATSMETRLKNALGEDQQQRNVDTINRIQSQIQKYLITKTWISAATAIVGAIWMWILDIDFILVSALLLFALNFIPNIGSIISSSIPSLICLLQYGFGYKVIIFAVLITATQMLFGNIIEPQVQGDRLNLAPIMVLISLILWGWLWGIPGMFISVPLTSAINIILKEINPNNVVSALISGE